MYYYYKDNQYVGCGNEDIMAGCESRETGPTLPTEPDPKRQESLSYLSSTDWYYARLPETGQAVPQDVKDKRIAARAYLNQE